MEDCIEPLNLTVKKQKPIAVVAPSAIVDNNRIKNEQKNFDVPEDLSLKYKDKINNNYDCLDLSVVSKYDKNEHNFIKENNELNAKLKNYIEKDDFTTSASNEKNIFNEGTILYDNLKGQESKDIFKDAYKINDNIYDLASKPDGIYSMINTLAEQKFLTALYMNSILAHNFSYGFGYPTNGFLEQNLLNNQSVLLNNYVDKQKTEASKFFKYGDKFSNLETVINNEINTEFNNFSPQHLR